MSTDAVSGEKVRIAGRRTVMTPDPVPDIVSTGTETPDVILGDRSTSYGRLPSIVPYLPARDVLVGERLAERC